MPSSIPNNKIVKYDQKDFAGLKQNLTNFVKQYFGDSYPIISDYSIEGMLLDMNAYVGDILNFYNDETTKERYRQLATQPDSVYRNAYNIGYKPKTVSVAVGEVIISQIVPATSVNGQIVPDVTFAGIIAKDAVFGTNSQPVACTSIEDCNMADYFDSVPSAFDNLNVPTQFRIFNRVKVRTGLKKTKRITVDSPTPYLKLLVDTDVAFIQSVTDSEENTWYEVDFLAQDTVFESVPNFGVDNQLQQFNSQTPFLLRTRRASRRFEVVHNSSRECYLQFGSGIDLVDDTLRTINVPDLLTTNELSNPNITNAFVVDNLLRNDSFGLTPFGTSLTINYVTSRGEQDNVPSGTVNKISKISVSYPVQNVPNFVTTSFVVSNTEDIVGAQNLGSLEKINYESAEAFASQNRCITVRDYIIRSKLMPSLFGKIVKVFVDTSKSTNTNGKVLNIYVMSKNTQNQVVACNRATKQNLQTYLSRYKSENDFIVIKDAYIINFGVDFDYIVRAGFNKDEVFLKLSEKIEQYFNIDDWDINQAIMLEELRLKMYEVEGVLSVPRIQFFNNFDINAGYSGIEYDVRVGGENYDTSRGILYPPQNPAIFELKFPKQNIRGTHV
jgi:hypothetical protein